MQLSSEKLKSNLSHKVEAKNKSIVELENVVNEVRMKNKQLNNKVRFKHFLPLAPYSLLIQLLNALCFMIRFKNMKLLFKIWNTRLKLWRVKRIPKLSRLENLDV